eukprot:m51a1_g9465 hypothetical protein (211) ;mRNA; r:545978-546610
MNGAMIGRRAGLNLFGSLVAGGCSAVGGGTMREMLAARPAPWLHGPSSQTLYTIGAGALAGALAPLACLDVIANSRPAKCVDALSLGINSNRAGELGARTGAGAVRTALYAGLGGFGGGCVRDVIAGRQPRALTEGTASVGAAVGGALATLAAHRLGVGSAGRWGVGVATAIVLKRALLAALRREQPCGKPKEDSDAQGHKCRCSNKHKH